MIKHRIINYNKYIAEMHAGTKHENIEEKLLSLPELPSAFNHKSISLYSRLSPKEGDGMRYLLECKCGLFIAYKATATNKWINLSNFPKNPNDPSIDIYAIPLRCEELAMESALG